MKLSNFNKLYLGRLSGIPNLSKLTMTFKDSLEKM